MNGKRLLSGNQTWQTRKTPCSSMIFPAINIYKPLFSLGISQLVMFDSRRANWETTRNIKVTQTRLGAKGSICPVDFRLPKVLERSLLPWLPQPPRLPWLPEDHGIMKCKSSILQTGLLLFYSKHNGWGGICGAHTLHGTTNSHQMSFWFNFLDYSAWTCLNIT